MLSLLPQFVELLGGDWIGDDSSCPPHMQFSSSVFYGFCLVTDTVKKKQFNKNKAPDCICAMVCSVQTKRLPTANIRMPSRLIPTLMSVTVMTGSALVRHS